MSKLSIILGKSLFLVIFVIFTVFSHFRVFAHFGVLTRGLYPKEAWRTWPGLLDEWCTWPAQWVRGGWVPGVWGMGDRVRTWWVHRGTGPGVRVHYIPTVSPLWPHCSLTVSPLWPHCSLTGPHWTTTGPHWTTLDHHWTSSGLDWQDWPKKPYLILGENVKNDTFSWNFSEFCTFLRTQVSRWHFEENSEKQQYL